MKKLFILPKQASAISPYNAELECAFKYATGQKYILPGESLNVDYLLNNEIEVLISAGLDTEWFYTLKGLNIVHIVLGNRDKHQELADIVIDFQSDDDKRYFTGKKFSLCHNGSNDSFNINEILDLITKLAWDSDFFGFNVAFLSCMHLTPNIFYRIKKFVQKENIRLIEYLCNCHDRRSVRVAEENGLRKIFSMFITVVKILMIF